MTPARSAALGLIAALTVGCAAAGAQALDAAKLDQLRSLVAEAAMVEQADRDGRVTRPYAAALRQSLSDDLAKLEQEPQFAAAARRARSALARHDAAALAALRDRLVALERSHGRAG